MLKFVEITFILGVLFLPIYQTINHWFFGASIISSVIVIILSKNFSLIKRYLRIFLLSSIILFLIRLITLLYTPDLNLAIKELQRALPFLLYPIIILFISTKPNFKFKDFEKKAFWALTIGCLITLVICWGNVILNMEENPIPANKLFGWKKSGANLTRILDLHPPYLGLLISGSILFLLKQFFYGNHNKSFKVLLLFLNLILIVFLFNITARNTLLFLLLVSIGFFIYAKHWKFLFGTALLCAIAAIVVVNHPSEYYRLKMYHMLGVSDNTEVKDKRFERLKASIEVFNSSPLLGVGLGKDIEMKVAYYEKIKDEIAVKKRFNSHNQFFEYMAAYGLLGGLTFLLVVAVSIKNVFLHKRYFYLLLILNIFIASLTESVFERALGIQYYSLIISLSFMSFNSLNKNKSKDETTPKAIH